MRSWFEERALDDAGFLAFFIQDLYIFFGDAGDSEEEVDAEVLLQACGSLQESDTGTGTSLCTERK